LNAIGIDLGGTNLRASLVTEEGEVQGRLRKPIDDPRDGEGVVNALVSMVRELSGDSNPAVIGIGAAGPLDHVSGSMYSPPNLPGLNGMALGPLVEAGTGLPTFLENDANAAVYGEYCAGAGKGEAVFIGLTLGTGVGGGIILDGEVLRGRDGAAGELGHIVIDPAGLPCACKGRGHLESYASARATASRFVEGLQEGKAVLPPGFAKPLPEIEALDVFDLAKGGHAFAGEVLAESGRWLGIGIASLVAVFDPETVVLLGGMAGAFELLAPPLVKSLESLSIAPSGRRVQIVSGLLGDDAGVVGAASLALDRFARSRDDSRL